MNLAFTYSSTIKKRSGFISSKSTQQALPVGLFYGEDDTFPPTLFQKYDISTNNFAISSTNKKRVRFMDNEDTQIHTPTTETIENVILAIEKEKQDMVDMFLGKVGGKRGGVGRVLGSSGGGGGTREGKEANKKSINMARGYPFSMTDLMYLPKQQCGSCRK